MVQGTGGQLLVNSEEKKRVLKLLRKEAERQAQIESDKKLAKELAEKEKKKEEEVDHEEKKKGEDLAK